MSNGLHLLHTRPDTLLLATWMAQHHVRHERQTADLGDVLHGLLRAVFGSAPPQPFRYLDERRGLLAYTSLDAHALTAKVERADLLVAQTLGLVATSEREGFRVRPFPTEWPKGKILSFEVRVRPTVRAAKGEQDAFLHVAAQAPDAQLNREGVYAQWLREHLAPRAGSGPEPWQGAVDLLDVHLSAFQLGRVVRRPQASEGTRRQAKAIEGPDAVLNGRLQVVDPTAFGHLLARGVGRHRAFGFGMLLLSKAD